MENGNGERVPFTSKTYKNFIFYVKYVMLVKKIIKYPDRSIFQCQSLVLGLIAAAFASVVGWIREGELNFHNILLLSSSSLVTASIASLVLGKTRNFYFLYILNSKYFWRVIYRRFLKKNSMNHFISKPDFCAFV